MKLRSLSRLALGMVGALGATTSCNLDPNAISLPDGGAGGGSGSKASEDAGLTSELPEMDAGGSVVALSAAQVDFSMVPCGATPATRRLTVSNAGTQPLVATATTSGAAFSVSPSVLTLNHGGSAALEVTAAVPASATAGQPIVGELVLTLGTFAQTQVTVPLSVTPSGASLAFAPGQPSTFAFPLTEVGYPAALGITLVNAGNAPATFAVGPPSDPRFSLSGAAGVTLAPGQTWAVTAGFAPTDTTTARATSTVVTTGTTCGQSVQAITYSARATTGAISGWPGTLDFGFAACGGSAPAARSFSLTNEGQVDAHITQVALTGTPGFTTNAQVGRALFANGGALDISVAAPPIPALASIGPVTATLSIQTDAEPSSHTITLTEEPSGAILAFDTSGSASFGSFGLVPLLDSESQSLHVVNSGTGPASVVLNVSPSPAFVVSTPSFALDASGSQAQTVTFAPVTGGSTTGSISMTATGALCAPLPAPIPLSGTSGPAPNVTPTSLSFGATCGGAAPGAQTFAVENGGDADMTWSLGAVTGAGAAQYTLSAAPPPGVLIPGASSIVTVNVAPLPSPVADASPSAFAAQVVVATDVPFDPPHVVTLGETALGDRLSFATDGPFRFGQVPVGSVLTQPFTVVNDANPGSPAATLSFSLQGAGAGGYAIVAPTASSVAPNGGVSTGESVTFAPPAPAAYSATLGITTSDSVCSPLPLPIAITGTGTLAQVALSATTLAFGNDPSDPAGLVECGATGLPRTLTVSNVGNQDLRVTAITFGKGPSSPYALSGSLPLPLGVPIGGGVDVTITPSGIPASVADPNDAAAFSDTLTVTTDAPLDAPHAVSLVMQPRGAVIADTPVSTAWTFPSVSPGTIGTLTTPITNSGNAGVSVALTGLLQPTIFGLQSNPTSAATNGTTSIVAQFVPPSASGAWSDVGTLWVSAPKGLCQPLPSQWTNPRITLSGRSP